MVTSKRVGVSLVAQMIKNLPVMQETWVRSLGQKDPLEKGMDNPLQYSCLENSVDRGAWWVQSLKNCRTILAPWQIPDYSSPVIPFFLSACGNH